MKKICGIVGQSVYSLIPFLILSSAKTLWDSNDAPWNLKMSTTALLNPHCGRSGMPIFCVV